MKRLSVLAIVAAGLAVGACAPVKPSAPPPVAPTTQDALASFIAAALANAGPAGEPFPSLTEIQLTVGGERLNLVVADDASERAQGLRDHSDDLGSYDGMIFVFNRDVASAFTMSGVPHDLDIGWYDASGRRVASTHMTANTCCYKPGEPYRLAIETLVGDLPPGSLS